MERPAYKPIGTPVQELDTPALVVDVAAMERNIEALRGLLPDGPPKLRPHVTSHKSPAIAHRQLAAGGTTGGISVYRVGEAEVFSRSGFTDILVASQVVTLQKIARLCSLARGTRVSVAADSLRNVADLSRAAESHGVSIRVLVEINTRDDGPGVEPGRPTLELATAISQSKGLAFAGLMAGEASTIPEDGHDKESIGVDALRSVLETRELFEAEGLRVETVSIGDSFGYSAAASTPEVTEVRMDHHPLLDGRYCEQGPPSFEPAARVMGTVISHPTAGHSVTDCGHKALGPDFGLPALEGVSGARVTGASAEHGRVALDEEAQGSLDLGTKVFLVPWDLGQCANQYNYVHAVRDGRLEAVWEIEARGRWD